MKIELVKEAVYGEQPPNVCVRGSTNEFANLNVVLLPFLKETEYYLELAELEFITLPPGVDVVLSVNQDTTKIERTDATVTISLTREQWVDVVIVVATLAARPSQSYSEYPWLHLEDCNVILESTSL